MIEIHDLYFDWLMELLENPSPGVKRLCYMFDANTFERRVGNDVNRAEDGLQLRHDFLNDYDQIDIAPSVSNDFLDDECSWLEMLVKLAVHLDFLYDGGVQERFLEMVENMGLIKLIFTTLDDDGRSPYDAIDQDLVDSIVSGIDRNHFSKNGHGGIFPLSVDGDHHDQREVEIWAQQGAYFIEKLEGVLWTSTD